MGNVVRGLQFATKWSQNFQNFWKNIFSLIFPILYFSRLIKVSLVFRCDFWVACNRDFNRAQVA